MKSQTHVLEPDVQKGINYWAAQPASYDGVLGGFGNGSLPRVDSLGSRQFLMKLMPELCTVPSAARALATSREQPRRYRALDVGAGIGRVTSDVLLHLVSDVVLVEPVESFVREALARGQMSETQAAALENSRVPWRGIHEKTKSVTVIQDTLQNIDPCKPSSSIKVLGRVGYAPPAAASDLDEPFDVVWCQWCLGSISDSGLVTLFRRCRAALRDPGKSIIVVKENCCSDKSDGSPDTILDEEDYSVTRSNAAWKKIFHDAGLKLVHEQLQFGFPDGLFAVRMYALR